MVGVDKIEDYWEIFQVSRARVNSKTNELKENSFGNMKKFFRREKSLLKLGTNFWDVTVTYCTNDAKKFEILCELFSQTLTSSVIADKGFGSTMYFPIS